MVRTRRHLAVLTASSVIAVLGLAVTPSNAQTPPAVTPAFPPQLVTVDITSRADKVRLQSLGLDLTEHAGHDYVEVVLHSAAEQEQLRTAGFTWTVRIEDMLAREVERVSIDKSYAASLAAANLTTGLPSGRSAYRVLADFGAEIDALAKANPALAKRISIGKSVEGRDLTGIELGRDVTAPEDGRPVFLVFGAHHAREWPSAELPMEFAYDLVKAYTTTSDPEHARVKRLLDNGRIVIVPVSNPDGYNASRTSGAIDLREVDGGGTGTILGTPGNAYKRKNCNIYDGTALPAGGCVAIPSNGGFGIGVDLNRNYGALWGGPGASDVTADPTYRGPAPFSEPETQAIRDLISSRQVTTLITNHTFSNLILRPVGVAPSTLVPSAADPAKREPAGFAPDECFTGANGADNGMQALGERMAAQNGYSNQFGWELYDTTGTTEDYSYNATGGYGYTFELGPNEFHPPFQQVVDEYTGNNDAAKGVATKGEDALTTDAADACPGRDEDHATTGGGNRTAFLLAFENAVDAGTHSTITGTAPAGTTIDVARTGVFPLFDGTQVADTVSTSMKVGPDGRFTYHVNPSTRPFVSARKANILGEPREQFTASGTAAPLNSTDTPYVLQKPAQVLRATVRAQQPAGADSLKAYDLLLLDPAGKEVASATGFAAENTISWTGPNGQGVPAGRYVLRVEAGLPLLPAYELEAAAYDIVSPSTAAQVESWTLTCTSGTTKQEKKVVVARGAAFDAGSVCAAAVAPPAGGTTPTTPPAPTTPVTGAGTVRSLDASCPPGKVPDNSHRDHEGNTHDRAIACVVWWEIAQGRTSTEYAPSVPVNREQMAGFVARLIEKSGGTLPASPNNAFSDDDSSFHRKAIDQLAQVGVVEGTGSGQFSPKAPVTRAQMAKFIVNAYQRVSGRQLARGNNAFSDDEGNRLESFINAAAQAGFTTGRNGAYEPGAAVQRDAMASFLARPLDLLVAEGTTRPKA